MGYPHSTFLLSSSLKLLKIAPNLIPRNEDNMHTKFRLSVYLLFVVQLFIGCSSDPLPEPDVTQPETPAGVPDAYQDKIRTQPYPKADNELYLNPAPLIVPQAMKTGERLQFSLSRTEDFSSPETKQVLQIPVHRFSLQIDKLYSIHRAYFHWHL